MIRLLRKEDYVCSTYRDHVHALSKGVTSREIMAELFGKKTGCCRGQGGSMHMFSAEHGLVGALRLFLLVMLERGVVSCVVRGLLVWRCGTVHIVVSCREPRKE